MNFIVHAMELHLEAALKANLLETLLESSESKLQTAAEILEDQHRIKKPLATTPKHSRQIMKK